MRALPLLLLLALAGCGGSGGDSEARQLDEAAAAIDVNASLGNGATP